MSDKPRGLPGFLRRSLRLSEEEEEEDGVLVETSENMSELSISSSKERLPRVDSTGSANGTGDQQHHPKPPLSPVPHTGSPMATPNPTPVFSRSARSDLPSVPSPVLETIDDDNSTEPSGAWSSAPPKAPPSTTESFNTSYKQRQFDSVIQAEVVNMADLRQMSWNGIPSQYRAQSWKIMLGYVPVNSSRRKQTIDRKRAEYKDAIAQHYDIDDDSRTIQEQETLRQVLVDVPRTAPNVQLFRNDKIRKLLTRLLYIWAMRHPASSYVQGINDLATPFIVVFLADYFPDQNVLDGKVMDSVTDTMVEEIEADVYWCVTNLLAGIQDHYTSDQPGVQRMVMRLEELVTRIDANLTNYLKSVGIEFIQFSFKWMNCLLLREFSLTCVQRLWDTYIGEGDGGFEDFHVYVCAAFLCQFSGQLQQMEFDQLFSFMQHIPTEKWGDTEIEILLSQAFVLSTLFKGSDAHLSRNR